MDGYVCLKPLKISGTEYQPGNHIPAEEISPSRVRALKQMGYIAEQDAPALTETATDTRDEPEPVFMIPISAESGEGAGILANEESVSAAAVILQMTVEQAGEAIKDTADETALRLVHALDSRKGVKTAAAAKLEELRGGDAG